jgi:hypothetical protein
VEYEDIFHLEGDQLKTTDILKHKIVTLSDKVICVKPYKLPFVARTQIDDQIKELIEKDIIEESISPWNAPALVVPKKTDASGVQKYRMVIDYRRLNEITVGDTYPMPMISELIENIGAKRYFTKLDLKSGFYHIPLEEESKEKTAFSTPSGKYQYKKTPMGLKSSPATFVRMMNAALTGLTNFKCLVYMDDILVYGKNEKEHFDNLIEVFKRLRKHNLTLNPDKCEFMKNECEYLGFIIDEEGVKPDPGLVAAVVDFNPPRTK